MTIRKLASVCCLLVIASFISRGVGAQSLANTVSSIRNGKVRLTFAARPEVCGSGNSISRGSRNRMNWTIDQSADVIFDEECSHQPVRVVLFVESGQVTRLRTYVGGRWRPLTAGITDLGAVSSKEAANFLLSLAASGDGSVGRDAILPATLADSVAIWPQLIRLARDESRAKETRRQALFWLGQAASDAIAPTAAVSGQATQDEEVKKQAVFALSQRKRDDAVPALIQVARNNRDPELRRTALFWLGQTTDPRAISLFEEILTR